MVGNTTFTILRRAKSWQKPEVMILLEHFFSNERVSVESHSEHPGVLMFHGAFDRAACVQALELVGSSSMFDHQVVQGIDHPALPFRPSP